MWTETTTSFVRDERGTAVGIVTVARNIDERKRAEATLREREAQLLQAQKMEAVGRLAGGIAHDFNNILTVIGGRAHLLLDALEASAPGRHAVELIQQAAERAAKLTRQLLAFSRKQMLQPRVLDLTAVVTGLMPMLRHLIGEHIQLTVVPGATGSVRADATQVEQVIANLAINAQDAMPDGGRLTIETADVDLGAAFTLAHPGARPGRHVMLSVTDTGHGIDPDIRAKVFEPFFTTKEPARGTGLGLSTVYGIIKQHDGYVAVESELGHGSTFTVYFPSVEAPPDATDSVDGVRPVTARVGAHPAGRGRAGRSRRRSGEPRREGIRRPRSPGRRRCAQDRARGRAAHRPSRDRRGDAGHERPPARRADSGAAPGGAGPVHVRLHRRRHRAPRRARGGHGVPAEAVHARGSGHAGARDARRRGRSAPRRLQREPSLERWGDPTSVLALGNRKTAAEGMCDNFTAMVRFPGGRYAVISQTLAAFQCHQVMEVVGSEGAIRGWWSAALDRPSATFALAVKRRGHREPETIPIERSGEVFELHEQLARTVTAFQARRSLVTRVEARKRVIVCVEAERSLREGREIPLGF